MKQLFLIYFKLHCSSRRSEVFGGKKRRQENFKEFSKTATAMATKGKVEILWPCPVKWSLHLQKIIHIFSVTLNLHHVFVKYISFYNEK